MRRAGFTLIEIMIVVGIIAIMLASAVMSVASGRGAVQVKEAPRGVIQLSRYASALALLRQRPVVVTFHHKGRIDVRISGEATGKDDIGAWADPIYREVDGKATPTAAEYAAEMADDDAEEDVHGQSGGKETTGKNGGSAVDNEKKGFFYTKRVLDPEALAKEDAEGVYEGVTFTVEVLGEDGQPLDRELAAARSLRQPQRVKKNAEGEPVAEEEEDDEPPVSVTYETNGNVNPHRIIVRLTGESDADEGFSINISRSGRATVGDDEEESGRASRRRRR